MIKYLLILKREKMSVIGNSDKCKNCCNNCGGTGGCNNGGTGGCNNGGCNNSDNTENADEKKSNDPLSNYNAEWSSQHEEILVEWADKAICYRWLHSTSHNIYSWKNRWFTVPVIIMSTLTGTANFAQERVPENFQPIFQLIVGSVNIFAGILTTIQQFLKISELNESHRISSISWDKFYRNIKLELAKSRTERIPAYQMLKISKEEFDRLMETSPPINEKTAKKFSITFSGGPLHKSGELTEKQREFKALYKPAICNILESTKNYVYKETQEDIEKKKARSLIKNAKENNEIQRKSIAINKFIERFNAEFQREPTVEEIYDNMRDNNGDLDNFDNFDDMNNIINTTNNIR